MASYRVKQITELGFYGDIIRCTKPAIVHFGARWCSPCRMLQTAMDKLAYDFKSRLIVGYVDSDMNPNLTSQYAIMNFPTVLLFHHGRVVERFQGTRGKREYARHIHALLPYNLKPVSLASSLS